MATKITTYKATNLDLIIEWCKENNQVEWLKTTASKKTPYKVYPKKKEIVLDENGNPKLNSKGKVKMVSKADKSQEPTIKYGDISFIQLKYEFFQNFFPAMLPKAKDKELSMWDKIKSL